MAGLNAKKRASLRKDQFGLPEKATSPEGKKESGNYPIPDKTHAVSAKGFAKQNLKKGNLSKTQYDRIVKKANTVLGGSRSSPTPRVPS